jgi:hypothetical protein
MEEYTYWLTSSFGSLRDIKEQFFCVIFIYQRSILGRIMRLNKNDRIMGTIRAVELSPR